MILSRLFNRFIGLCSTKPIQEVPAVRASFEATVTTGLEPIAAEEIKEKLSVEATTQQGRILFQSQSEVREICKLKCINNLFVVIYDKILDDSDMPQDEKTLEELLTRIGQECDWRVGLQKWQEVCQTKFDMNNLMKKDENLRAKQPKFRVSSNRHGKQHKFTSPEICSTFGSVVDSIFGWPIKMKQYDMEIMCNFNENHIYVALTLTQESLDCRHIVEPGLTTLRGPTCYALLRLAKIQTGDIVIDPMAGSGAIPVECCRAWEDNEWYAYTIGGEIQDKSVKKSRVNLNIFQDEDRPPLDLLQLDVTSLPFRQETIDVFVSDLPFGKRHGSKRINMTLYPALLNDMARVSRLITGRAVLLTQDFKSMNLAMQENKEYWKQKSCQFVKVGNLNCYMYHLTRSDSVFELKCPAAAPPV